MVDVTATLAAADRAREADKPHSLVVRFGPDQPLRLDAGVDLSPFQIAYQTYGPLNAAAHQRGADLPCAHRRPACRQRPSGHRQARLVGDHGRPGKPIDTERYFVICPNVVGACMGTTGPASTNPETGKPWGLDFPVITIRDMVRAQAMLLDHLGIELAVRGRRRLDGRHAGAAMGGELSGARVLGAADRDLRRAIRRRTSPSTKSAGRR